MKLDLLPRGKTVRAAGGINMPFPGGRFILIMLFLGASVFACLPASSFAQDGKWITIRNDSVSLTPDLEKGRFGSGKLYFNDPIDLAVDEDNNLYVLDAGNYRIQVVSEKGRYVDKWGARGDQDGYFDDPVALTINPDSDFLIVLDQGTYRVHKFELDGSSLLSFGEEGRRKGQLEGPVDVTIDALDYIYVLDRERQKVLKFHKSGSFVDEWGGKGRQDERLQDPVSIAYSDELTGYVYVLDAGKMALLKYKRDGDLDEIIKLPPDLVDDGMKPVKVEINGENEIFVLDGLHGKLIKLYGYEMNVFQLTSEDLMIDQMAGLAIDDENNIYISDLKMNRFLRFLLELN